MILSRKLKKGCRTLNGNPRTKWQRKGRLYIAKILNEITNTAYAAAVEMGLFAVSGRKTFPSGGIVVPSPPKVGVAQMPTGEMVINREQVARLKHAIDINPMDSARATILNAQLSGSDLMGHLREKVREIRGE